MNVYTHIEMGDLAGDVENLPALPNAASLAGTASNTAPVAYTEPTAAPAIPSELASLASNWSALPDHIRQAIATLAEA